jgi:hypothetical protein
LRLPDGRFLRRNRGEESVLPGGVLTAGVHPVAYYQHDHRQRDDAIAQYLLLVFFEEGDCVFDFEGELVGL